MSRPEWSNDTSYAREQPATQLGHFRGASWITAILPEGSGLDDPCHAAVTLMALIVAAAAAERRSDDTAIAQPTTSVTTGDSYDNALAKYVIPCHRMELIDVRAP